MEAQTDRIIEVTEAGLLLEEIYQRILEPNFPAQELETYQDFVVGLTSSTTVFTMLDSAGAPVAAAVGNHWKPHPVVLLTYLAVTVGRRSTGIGGRLLEHVLGVWQRRYRAHAVLAEIEDPAFHEVHPRFGDPARRQSFYTRYGATEILRLYVQPEVRTGYGRRSHMRLIAFQPQAGGAGISHAILREFLPAYFEATEGRPPTDAQAQQIFAALTPTGEEFGGA